jgi:hypothetical protein
MKLFCRTCVVGYEAFVQALECEGMGGVLHDIFEFEGTSIPSLRDSDRNNRDDSVRAALRSAPTCNRTGRTILILLH